MLRRQGDIIDKNTTFNVRERTGAVAMLDDESPQQYSLFELVTRAYDKKQSYGFPYTDTTLEELQNTWKDLGDKSPEALVAWVEEMLRIELIVVREA